MESFILHFTVYFFIVSPIQLQYMLKFWWTLTVTSDKRSIYLCQNKSDGIQLRAIQTAQHSGRNQNNFALSLMFIWIWWWSLKKSLGRGRRRREWRVTTNEKSAEIDRDREREHVLSLLKWFIIWKFTRKQTASNFFRIS